MEWLSTAAHGLIVAIFIAFFWIVIRLWLHLARSASTYNLEQPVDGARGSGATGPQAQVHYPAEGGGA